MSKHTPGPWEINQSNCDIEAEEGGISICYPFDSGTAIGNANARLIAAAPELLSLLKEISENSTAFNSAIEMDFEMDGESWMDRVKEIISKIESTCP